MYKALSALCLASVVALTGCPESSKEATSAAPVSVTPPAAAPAEAPKAVEPAKEGTPPAPTAVPADPAAAVKASAPPEGKPALPAK
jgi:hypothetical protein